MLTKQFILAGKAIFTVSNGKGEHFTFRVKRKAGDGVRPDVYFVGVLTGANFYSYIGVLHEYTGKVRLTERSEFVESSKTYRVAAWALALIWNEHSPPEGYKLQNAGKCGRCGRMLTTPDSIKTGIGPECYRQIYG